MHAREFINYDLEFDLNNLYIPIEEGIIGMLNERKTMRLTMNPLKKLIVQIGDVLVE
jgi:hypothetical protein